MTGDKLLMRKVHSKIIGMMSEWGLRNRLVQALKRA